MTYFKTKAAYLALLSATAFAPGDAGWKLDADGKPEFKDGNPIYVDASGREMTVDHGTIARLNGEAKNHREAKEALERKLEAYKDIKDPAAALAAIQKLADIDQSKLIDSGKLDDVKRQITEQFQAQIVEKDKALTDLQSRFDNSQIQNLFAGSEFVRDRIAVPRDMFEATFRNSFKLEDGKITAYGRDGNRIMSKKTVGEYADAAEALEILVDMHPQKDMILKADGGSGSGNNGAGGGRGGGRTVKRVDFDRMSPVEQADLAKKMGAGEINIVD